MSFEFIPGACYYPTHGGIGVWIKYKRNKKIGNDIEVKQWGTNWQWIICPDRELLINYGYNSPRPIDENWDEYIALTNFHSTARDMGVKIHMLNYPQHLPNLNKASPLHRRKGSKKRDGIITLSDSGGFQLTTGRINYLSPKDIVLWYNDNVDYGLVLDMPIVAYRAETTAKGKRNMIKRMANIQKRNTEVMAEHLTNDTKLMNIMHGMTFGDLQAYRKVVERDDISSMAISDSYSKNPLGSIDHTLSIIEDGKRYDWYHVLGIYNPGVLVPLIKLGVILGDTLLTSDASTHVQSAMGRLYHHQRRPDTPMERHIIGLSGKTKYPSTTRHLPCSCPVCSRIKYTDIFSIVPAPIPNYLLMQHNQFEIIRYTNQLADYAEKMSHKQYLAMALDQMSNKSAWRGTITTILNFLQAYKEQDLAYAQKEFRYDLGTTFKAAPKSVEYNLLGEPLSYDVRHSDRIVQILERYEAGIEEKLKVSKGLQRSGSVHNKVSKAPGMKTKRRRLAA